MRQNILVLTLLLFASKTFATNSGMSIDEYLQQVSNNNPAVHAALIGQESAKTQVQDSNIMFLPTLEIMAQNADSQQATYMGQFYGTENNTQSYMVGVKEMTNFGLSGEVSYQLNHFDIQGVSPGFLPYPNYYYSQPGIQLNQSLWKNGFGAQDRALEQQKRLGAEANYYNELFNYRRTLIEAQNTYLQLYYLRKSVAALQQSLGVASKLREWSQGRAKSELGDRSDFLQTDAAYSLRQLEIVRNENDLRVAARAFNSMRGIDSDDVGEQLSPVTKPVPKLDIEKLSRIDTQASAKMLEAARAGSKVNEQTAKPTLDIFASYSYSEVGLNEQQAAEFGYHPILAYGLKFSMPLYYSKADRVSKSFTKEIEAAEYKLRRQQQEQTRDLKILLSQIQNSGERLKLSEKLEAAQKTKLDVERERHRRGRTSLFQVLQFEQDYVTAQLSRISTELEYHMNLNQLDLYESVQ